MMIGITPAGIAASTTNTRFSSTGQDESEELRDGHAAGASDDAFARRHAKKPRGGPRGAGQLLSGLLGLGPGGGIASNSFCWSGVRAARTWSRVEADIFRILALRSSWESE